MKILLYNQNPVVEKLVVLSARKSRDQVINVRSLDELISEEVELLLIDDDVFIIDEDSFEVIKSKVKFKKSCLIASRNSNVPKKDFDDVLQKPFLPTDLVAELEKLKKASEETKKVEESPIDGLDFESLSKIDAPEKIEPKQNIELNLDGLLDDDDDEVEIHQQDNLINNNISAIESKSNLTEAQEINRNLEKSEDKKDSNFNDLDFSDFSKKEIELEPVLKLKKMFI